MASDLIMGAHTSDIACIVMKHVIIISVVNIAFLYNDGP